MMKSVRELNLDKLVWMEYAEMLHESTTYRSSPDNLAKRYVDQSYAFYDAQRKTARAIAAGVALAAMDGPLPVMDVIGFGVATSQSALAWYDYFTLTS
jgi:hypothetical protein